MITARLCSLKSLAPETRNILRTGFGQRSASTYEERRVVVTGLGGVTPLGVNIPTAWQGLIDGKCAIKNIEENMDKAEKEFLPIYNSLPSKIAARIPLKELNEMKEKHFSSSDSRVMSKAMMLGVLASEEALQDAGNFNHFGHFFVQ
jgi:3-oxoacyl-[acyl-carrier-protein] synthase II